ncbi:preprotein translocase subunit SecG [Buchnera aphidicola]|uniref:Protein-export membrane protein SecG n=1 Tax=Buchnera aphidicola subsp. Uroleucon sonchi TaxID=118118 RepID=A0A6C1F6I1_BUCUN|nr:preprotein translocase subunit SecG [Buchnera aphidicola]QIE02081.1 preprotein translocase subunit SecG [Buchnera aphidicola (Uroleucon sonchi)]
MYWCFLVLFIFISISLIFLIVLQPSQGLNNTIHSNIKNNDKFFRSIKKNDFLIKIIRILSFLFLIISIILCNINNRTIDSNLFLKNNTDKKIIKHNMIDKKQLHSDIPNELS